MAFTRYILFSPAKNKYYVGFTGDDMQERLRKHNSDHKGFTGGTGDWYSCYTENYKTKADAIKREKEIKQWKSRKIIERLACIMIHLKKSICFSSCTAPAFYPFFQ